jgi:hypothetical protein
MIQHAAILCLIAVTAAGAAPKHAKPVLTEAKRIWDQAPHNAFTDLVRHEGRWYCVFREGKHHVSPDGALRVITSKDGNNWKSLALVTHDDYDLRDAKLTVLPDGRFMLNGAGMQAEAKIRYQSMTWFSNDKGKTWSQENMIGDSGFWLWRAQWHDGNIWSFGYRTDRVRTNRIFRLYRSKDGKKYDTVIPQVNIDKGVGEDRILFMKDGSALCLLRHETGNKMAFLGKAKPPFTKWTWKELNKRIGGPNMIQLPDGNIIAATRFYDRGVRTSLSWLDPAAGTLSECLKLPSGGDTSYAGMVWHEDQLWVSYYSSHEKKTSIYLAKIRFE